MNSTEEVATLFLDGLDDSIRNLVARHREAHRRTPYLELVQLSQAEGVAARARSPCAAKPPAQGPSRVIPLHYIPSSSE